MTNEPKAGGGLDPEMLAAYIDKRLPPDERAVVEAKLAADPDSYELLVELIHANEALKGERPAEGDATEPAERVEPQGRTGAVVPMAPKPKRAGGWMIAGGVLAAAAAIVLVVRLQPELWQRVRGGDAVDPQLAKLVEAVGEERYIEARLTGGFKYGPLRSVTRGPGDLSQQNLALLAAAGELQKRAQTDPSAASLHAWGVAQVVMGDIEAAVSTLQNAVELSRSAHNLSDLSGALLEAAGRGRPELLASALEAASEAVATDPQLSEARFNQAIALERLHLIDEATAAWQAFLELVPRDGWSDHARARITALGKQSRIDPLRPNATDTLIESLSVTHQWSRMRFIFERQLLPAICKSPGVDWDRGHLRSVLVARQRVTGDRLPVDILDRLETPANCRAVMAMRDAATFFDADELRPARGRFDEAVNHLPSDHPLQLLIEFYQGHLDYLSGDRDSARQRLSRLVRRAEDRQYPVVEASAVWILGVGRIANGEFSGAVIDTLEHAARLAHETGESVLEGRIRNQLADTAEYLGDSQRSWTFRLAALRLASQTGNPRLRQSVYGSLSTVARRRDLTYASTTLLSGLSKAVGARGASASILTTTIDEMDGAIAVRDLVAAEALVERASRAMADLDNDPRIEGYRARLAAARARLAMALGDHHRALELAEKAAINIRRAGELPRIDLLCLRAAALVKLGRVEEARADVTEVIDTLRHRRASGASIFGSPELARLAASVDIVLSDALEPHLGLQLVEELRAVISPVPLPRLGSSRDCAPTLIFKVLRQKTLVWKCDEGTISMREIELGRHAAVELVKRVRAAAFSPSPGTAAWSVLADASRILLADEVAWLSAQPTVWIVPDWPLDGLPFAALGDEGTRRYLIQDATLVLTDAVPQRAPARIPRAPQRVLVAAVPRTSLGADLPAAEAEGRAIADSYRFATLLRGLHASGPEILALGGQADVVHIAAHAVVDRIDGRRSRIVLSAEPLFGEDIVKVDWRRVQVAVLAGCSTAEPDNRPASPLTLASQAHAAGARRVIATLAPLDDRSSLAFFSALHERLAAGLSAENALRDTQVAAIEGRISGMEDRSLWSQVVVVGD